MTTTTAGLNLRPTPGTTGTPITVIPRGAAVIVGKSQSGWRRTFYNGLAGWTSDTYLADITTVPFIDAAFPHLGKWYHIGGNGPENFDCSGFCLYTLRTLRFPGSGPDRTANSMMHMFREGNWNGTRISVGIDGSLAAAKAGDITFFGYGLGHGDHHASHVVFQMDPKWVIGANGGNDKMTTDAQAKAKNAKVRFDLSNYRETAVYPHKKDRLEIWRPIY